MGRKSRSRHWFQDNSYQSLWRHWQHGFKQLILRPAEVNFATYHDWYQQFLKNRLILGLSLAILYFSGRTLLIAWETLILQSGDLFRLIYHGLTALIMIISLGIVQRSRRSWYLMASFFVLSWGITIVTNLPKGWDDVIEADYKGWTLGFFSIAAIIPFSWPLHLISHLGAYFYYFFINIVLQNPVIPDPTDAASFFFDLVWISALPVFVVHLYERLSKSEFFTRRALREEQQRSEQLLLDILPAAIATRLRDQRITIADRFDEVTVLFADIVGFTELSAELTPTAVVTLLNDIFSRFDRLTQTYHLEKIKTIGDAYMVVGGLPEICPDHAQKVAAMALAMQSELLHLSRNFRDPLTMRMGIHTGPVVAGVIGLHKFAYDLWGDTVNIASRMESHSLPGKIQITHSTYEQIKQIYACQERGYIEVKGKGLMQTYWLEESHSE